MKPVEIRRSIRRDYFGADTVQCRVTVLYDDGTKRAAQMTVAGEQFGWTESNDTVWRELYRELGL